MTPSDLVLYIGLMISSWVLGFSGGYSITRFRDALSKVS